MASAQLTWTANNESDLAGYKVYRGFGGAATTFLVQVGKVTTFTDSPLPVNQTSVTYNLTAVDLSGNESPHTIDKTVVYDANPPQAPVGLNVVVV